MYKARRAASHKVKRRIGKYELGRTIGEGTFAKVRFAKNLETGDHVAIKILDKAKVQKHKLVEQIRREICTMKLIQHPNVVRLYEVMGSKARIFIVLEYVTGGELHDIIAARGSLKEDEARRYFQQLINAVDYCHSRGVYHRDLKLENLLLDTAGNLKISDFGLSAISDQVKADGLLHTTCGTPNYVAPEVIEDKGYDGALADLWSCGVILFVLLAGYLPFEDDNVASLYKKISRAQFTCPSWFSDGAKRLIARILDPNPSTRITIPQVLKDPWFKKGYKPPVFYEKYQPSLDDVDAAFGDSEEKHVKEEIEGQPASMNAFELISLNKGLNLDNLFESDKKYKREIRFTSQCPPKEIINRIEEAAKPLGFDTQKKDYKMQMENLKAGRKGNLNVATEVFQVAPSLHVVELKKEKGDTLEFQKSIPLYLSEMAPPQYRGAINNGFELCISIGILIANLINYGVEKIHGGWGWRISLSFAAVPAAFLTIGAIFLPETPSFLIQRHGGNVDEARIMLQRLRGTTGVQKELDDLVSASNVSRTIKHPFRNIMERRYRPQLVIALLIPFFNQVTGINVINFYAPVMFRTIGLKESASLMSAVVTRVCATVANIVAMVVVDRFGRRKLLLVGGAQMILSQFTVGAILAVKFKDHGAMEKEYAYLVLVVMCVFVAGFAWSWGPLTYLVPTEICPLEIRSAGQSVVIAVIFMVTFVIGQTFLAMLCHLKFGTFFLFGGWVCVMTAFVFFFLPETKQLPMEQMEQVWRTHWFWKKIVSGAEDQDHVVPVQQQQQQQQRDMIALSTTTS